MSPLTLNNEKSLLTPTKVTHVVCGGHLFSPRAPLSWGAGSGFSIIFQGSTTSISQPWHPTATVTEWQDATFECHVLYITKPLSSWGCHQASTSTGELVLQFGVCLHGESAHHRYFSFCTYVYVCALSVSSMSFVQFLKFSSKILHFLDLDFSYWFEI